LYTSLVFVALTAGGVAASILPSLIYHWQAGGNNEVGQRNSTEGEVYGMKLAQLVLPVPRHRISKLGRLRADYENRGIHSNENSFSALGAAATVGFVFLLGRMMFGTGGSTGIHALNGLGTLNLAALLLGTMGGLGSIFSYLITPQIRCYNRISVYIACISLLAGGLLLQQLSQRMFWSERPLRFRRLLLAILIAGLVDQIPRGTLPDYLGTESRWNNDAAFFGQIEAAMPDQAMIAQLPYQSFPENGPIAEMHDYEHLRGYLHSTRLRWSYGAMRGREADVWLADVAMHPYAEQVQRLAIAGFSGIYLDRFGYADRGSKVEAILTRLLGVPPLASPDKNQAFFSLIGYAERLKQLLPPEEWHSEEQARRDVLATRDAAPVPAAATQRR
jgi:phosphoglycerol transferase